MIKNQSDIEVGRQEFIESLAVRAIQAESASRIFDAWIAYMPMFGRTVMPEASQLVARTYRLAQEDVLTLAVELTELAFDFRPSMQDLEKRDANVFEPMKTVSDVCFLINDLSKEKGSFTGLVEKIDGGNASSATASLWTELHEIPNQFYSSAFAVKGFIDPQYVERALGERQGFLGGWHKLKQSGDRIWAHVFEKGKYRLRRTAHIEQPGFYQGDIIELRQRQLIVADYVLFRLYAIVSSVSDDGLIVLTEQKPHFVKPPVRTDLIGFHEYFLRESAVAVHGVWSRSG